MKDGKFLPVTGLRAAREKLNLSIEAAAAQLGTNSKRLGRWEREGHIHVDFLERAEQTYGVTLSKKRPPIPVDQAPVRPARVASTDIERAAQEVRDAGSLYVSALQKGADAGELESLERLFKGAIRRLLGFGMANGDAIERTTSAFFDVATRRGVLGNEAVETIDALTSSRRSSSGGTT